MGAQGDKGELKDSRADRRVQIWTAVIAALSGIIVAIISLLGTSRGTDSQVVPGPVSTSRTEVNPVTIAPVGTRTAASTTKPPAERTAPEATAISGNTLEVTWLTTAEDYADPAFIGKTFTVNCPSNGVMGYVWGDNIYFGRSSLCTAAVHNGRISLKDGGLVTIRMREPASFYSSSTKNGVVSMDFSGINTFSFEVL